ncbi:Ribonuclease H superfamily protein [Trifolium repens]|nr:Ribonuclease H superfamily protein [Trifolium repens]
MIKSVLQAIPSYVMSVYLLPDTTIKEIERLMNSFWWGGGTHNQGIRWLAWDRMAYPKALGGMGFRDLHSFNLAMIAKQGWNIMTKPNTLVAKIYKARYFPNSSLFEAQLGHNPSYAWRGIWKARHILINGCRWIIGNGANIKVMSDPWLREGDGAWVKSPQKQGAHSINVIDLMLPNEKKWDKEKIESLFFPDVVNQILDIPLFDMVEEDKLVWNDNTHGQYSVKSGYNVLLESIGKGVMPTSQGQWSNIWKIQAPPKAKHLLWRICKGCIPTWSRLQARCVPCPLNCPICEHCTEDDWHIFFNCNDSIQARRAAGLDHVVAARAHHYNNATHMIFAICNEEERSTAGRFAVLLWSIWKNRNEQVWNAFKVAGTSVGIKAMQDWYEWHAIQHYNTTSTQQQHVETWQKPPFDWYKCNVDAGFYKEVNKATAGWCVRDHLGGFITAGSYWKEGQHSIIEGEALALFEAMKAMEQRGFTHVIFETDSKSVVDAIHNIHGGTSEFSSLISNVNRILLSKPNFVVKFIKRQANMVAHTLARAAISWSRCCTFETQPLCITTYLNNEMI